VPSKRRPAFDVSVFVNCPFDEAYKPMLDAQLFCIHDCGFLARTALEASGSGETRLDKIARIISQSRFSVHDISRVELSPSSPLPRFNMPFECGLAFGSLMFGPTPRSGPRDMLLMAAEKFQDKLTLSDLAGQDASYHGNQPELVIKAVRGFLASKARGVLPAGVPIRGHESIAARFARFKLELPSMAAAIPISEREIVSLDYVAEWLGLATSWQAAHPK
jgi:hypothetical protein